jgi:uncharacterized membrane protein
MKLTSKLAIAGTLILGSVSLLASQPASAQSNIVERLDKLEARGTEKDGISLWNKNDSSQVQASTDRDTSNLVASPNSFDFVEAGKADMGESENPEILQRLSEIESRGTSAD